MEEHLLSIIAFVTIGFVALNALAFYSKRVSFLPDIIWILILGILYGFFSTVTSLPGIYLEPEIVLFVFVPILVFASTQKMCLSAFRDILTPATVAATIGILISMSIVAAVFHLFFAIPILVALLFGVVMSATDPLAVDAILENNTTIKPSTKLLIEGESILNDGFVVTVFGIIALLLFEGESFSLASSTFSLLTHVLGAIVVGVVLARVTRYLLHVWFEEEYIFMTNMTLALALGSFFTAELLGFSGILSVFAAALAFGYKPPVKTSNTETHRSIWGYFEYIANATLFFILGASVFTTVSITLLTFVAVAAAILALFASRFVALYLLNPWIRIKGQSLTRSDFWILNFAGARGAVSIALILLLPESFVYKEFFISIAFVMITFSLIVYPAIMQRLLKG